MPTIDSQRGIARLLSLLMVALMVSGLGLTTFPARQASAAPPGYTVTGQAYALNANVLGLVQTDVAKITLPPGGSATALPVNLAGGLANLGLTVLPSTSYDTSTSTTAAATSTAGVAGLNLTTLGLLNALLNIQNATITTTANSVSTGGAATVSGKTTVQNLVIGTTTLNGDVAPDTTINLSIPLGLTTVNVARVVVNEQIKDGAGGITVNGLHVQILGVNLGLVSLTGGDIVIASSAAKVVGSGAITPPTPSVNKVAGKAYGGEATVAGLVVVPKLAPTTVPPGGSNALANATIPVLGSVGAVTTSGADTTSAAQRSVNTRATVANVNLGNSLLGVAGLNNLVTADAVTVTSSSMSNGTTASSTGGVDFVNLRVAGVIVPNPTTANVDVSIPGIATITLNEQINTGNGTTTSGKTVNAIHILLLPAVSPLFPTGADLIVGSASSSVDGSGFTPSGGGVTVTGVSPNNGTTLGGTDVTITGAGFQSGPLVPAVTFGGTPATNVVVTSPTTITATTPLHILPDFVDVTVTNADNSTATLPNGYEYALTTPLTPSPTGVTACVANGIVTLDVSGLGLLPGASLLVNGQLATVTAVTGTGLTATIASSVLSNLNVASVFVITNPNSLPSIGVSLFPSACPNSNLPSIITVNPNRGPTDGGTVVTIGGANFQPGATVFFDGNAATVTSNSPTQLVVTTPAHAAGPVDVTVTNPGSQSTTANGAFTYIAANTPTPSASPSVTPTPGGSPTPSTNPSTSPTPNTPSVDPNTPPSLTNLFLVGTGLVPPGSGRVTFLATIQDNFALAGVQASGNPNGPWQMVVDVSGSGAGPFRVDGGFDTTNAAFGGSTATGTKTVYLRAVDLAGTPGPTQTLTITYTGTNDTFTDIANPNTTRAAAVYALAARGILRGYGDGTVGPNDPTLRAQMAAIISRGMGWGGEDHGNGFPDRGPVDDELWRQVGNLDFHGVARGYTDPATCSSVGSAAPCYIPLDQVSNIQTISFITRAMVALGYWTQQPDNDASLYPNITAASGHRQDIITYYRYLGAVYNTDPHAAWTTFEDPASRGDFAVYMWTSVQWRENSANWGIAPRNP